MLSLFKSETTHTVLSFLGVIKGWETHFELRCRFKDPNIAESLDLFTISF